MTQTAPLAYHQDNNLYTKKYAQENFQRQAAQEQDGRYRYGRVNLLQINAKLKDGAKLLKAMSTHNIQQSNSHIRNHQSSNVLLNQSPLNHGKAQITDEAMPLETRSRQKILNSSTLSILKKSPGSFAGLAPGNSVKYQSQLGHHGQSVGKLPVSYGAAVKNPSKF